MNGRPVGSKAKRLQFTTPKKCMEAYKAKVKRDGHGPGFRHGESQQQCTVCWLWKYKDGRCNHFRSRSVGTAKED